ncbi:hypothetical protein, partial [Halorubrum tropicale]
WRRWAMGAEAGTPRVSADPKDARGCDCDASGDVRRVVTPDGAVEVGRLCRRCRKDYWRVTS